MKSLSRTVAPAVAMHDPARAIGLYRSLADGGDISGLQRVADMMVKGEGVPADFAGGVALLESVTERGDFSGLVTIGDYYQIGTVADGAEAAAYFLRGAEQGDRGARVRLAQIQRAGAPDLPVDAATALASFGIAAETGDLTSRRMVAEMTARAKAPLLT